MRPEDIIAFCKCVKGVNAEGGGSRERNIVLLNLKDSVGTETNAYKLSE